LSKIQKKKKILNTVQKISSKIFLPLTRNPKNEMISLSYNVNDNVYFNQNLLSLRLVKIRRFQFFQQSAQYSQKPEPHYTLFSFCKNNFIRIWGSFFLKM